MKKSALLLFLLSLSTTICAQTAFAKNIFVTNTGNDSGSCGLSAATPCRSISQGIANASGGDQIIVGPGIYGDFNSDSSLTPGTGDEIPGNGGMININKPVSIVSDDGADFTIIRYPGSIAGSFGVVINADNVRFGSAGKGFSIVSGILGCSAGIRGLGAGSIIEGNTVTGCFRGFESTGSAVQLFHNRAAFNTEGGFVTRSAGALVTGNTATQNGSTGFVTESLDWHMTGNASIANKFDGASIDGNGVFVGNAMIGNVRHGLGINGFLVAGIVKLTISTNSFYGNLPQPQVGSCGIFNNTFTVIEAQNNFWGLPTGPGPDPADLACGNQINFAPWLNEPVAPADVFGPLVQGIHQIGGEGVPSGISGWSDDWQIIATGDADTFPQPTHYVMARPYAKGRVLAIGHESILTTGGLPLFDNTRFVGNVLQWLDQSGKQKVLYTTGHDEGIGPDHIETMRNLFPGYSFDPVAAPLTLSQLPSDAVLIIGHAKADFTAQEIEAIRIFVADGGGLLLAAQGWAWVPFWHRPLDEFPMNVVGEPFKIRWLPQVLHDPTNEAPPDDVIFHVFYADRRTMNPIKVINNLVSLTASNFRTAPTDSSVCGPGRDGMFLFDALLVFNSGAPPVSSLDIRVTELSNGNVLPVSSAVVRPDGGAGRLIVGIGGTLNVPFHGGYEDGILSNAGEFVSIPFTICLSEIKPFRLFVDVYGRSESVP